MSDKKADLRQQLFDAQEITPTLRAAYSRELDSMLHDTLTPRKRLTAGALLAVMVAGVVAEIRVMIVDPGGASVYGAAGAMAIAFAIAALWIARDLWRGSTSRKMFYKSSDLFYGAAGVLILVQLLHGMQAPSDPKSTFGVLFTFVFLFVCGAWSLQNRIASAELSLREEMLRIEYRLADLAERMGEKGDGKTP